MKVKYLALAVIYAMSASASAAIDEDYITYDPIITKSNTSEPIVYEPAEADADGGLAIGDKSTTYSSGEKSGGLAIAVHGAQAWGDAVAIGNGTYAVTNGIAIGSDAVNNIKGKSTNSNFANYRPTATELAEQGDGIAIGLQAWASDNSVAIGSRASVEGASDSLVIGYTATTTHFNDGKDSDEQHGTLIGIRTRTYAEGASALGGKATVTSANSVAIGYSSTTEREHSVSFGHRDLTAEEQQQFNESWSQIAIKRQLTQVADGEVSATSTDVVNGSQLYVVNKKIEELDGTITDINKELDTVIENGIQNAILFDTAQHDVVTLAAKTGGKSMLNGVKAGEVAAGSTDAVNGGQLFTTNQKLAETNDKFNDIHNQFQDIADDLQDAANVLSYDNDNHDSVTLAAKDGGQVKLSGLKDGTVAEGSSDAITGGQLYAAKQQADSNTTKIQNIEEKLNNGGIGIVQKDEASNSITIGKNDDGKSISVAGTDGDRVLTGIADGVEKNDLANYKQLQAYYAQAQQEAAENIAKATTETRTYTDSQIKDLEHRLDKKDRKQDAGIASAVAIASIPQDWKYQNSFGMGAAGYNGQGAIAAKYSHVLRKDLAFTMNIGLDTAWNATYSVGVNIGF